MSNYENPSPAEAWEKLSSKFSYLNRFPSVKKYLKLVELNGEYIPSPEYPIHFVGLTQIVDQPVETGFTIDKADVESCSALIIMNHETEVRGAGASGCKYYRGRMFSENGWDIGMFEKKNNPDSRNPKVVSEEIEAYRKINDMNIGKPSFLSPSFAPNDDELIMIDLKELGFKDIRWKLEIDEMSVSMQRRLLFQILSNYSNLNYTLYKANTYTTDIVKHGKGIWVKFNESDQPTIILSDFGFLLKLPDNTDEKISTIFTELITNLTGKDESDFEGDEDISFLEMFPFMQVDTHNRTISTTDSVIASIQKNGVSLTELLTSYYQNKFDELGTDNPVYELYKMLSENSNIDFSAEHTYQPFSLDVILADIKDNSDVVFRTIYLRQLASKTGLSLKSLLEELKKLK